jgi:hypothetical protein
MQPAALGGASAAAAPPPAAAAAAAAARSPSGRPAGIAMRPPRQHSVHACAQARDWAQRGAAPNAGRHQGGHARRGAAAHNCCSYARSCWPSPDEKTHLPPMQHASRRPAPGLQPARAGSWAPQLRCDLHIFAQRCHKGISKTLPGRTLHASTPAGGAVARQAWLDWQEFGGACPWASSLRRFTPPTHRPSLPTPCEALDASGARPAVHRASWPRGPAPIRSHLGPRPAGQVAGSAGYPRTLVTQLQACMWCPGARARAAAAVGETSLVNVRNSRGGFPTPHTATAQAPVQPQDRLLLRWECPAVEVRRPSIGAAMLKRITPRQKSQMGCGNSVSVVGSTHYLQPRPAPSWPAGHGKSGAAPRALATRHF